MAGCQLHPWPLPTRYQQHPPPLPTNQKCNNQKTSPETTQSSWVIKRVLDYFLELAKIARFSGEKKQMKIWKTIPEVKKSHHETSCPKSSGCLPTQEHILGFISITIKKYFSTYTSIGCGQIKVKCEWSNQRNAGGNNKSEDQACPPRIVKPHAGGFLNWFEPLEGHLTIYVKGRFPLTEELYSWDLA